MLIAYCICICYTPSQGGTMPVLCVIGFLVALIGGYADNPVTLTCLILGPTLFFVGGNLAISQGKWNVMSMYPIFLISSGVLFIGLVNMPKEGHELIEQFRFLILPPVMTITFSTFAVWIATMFIIHPLQGKHKKA